MVTGTPKKDGNCVVSYDTDKQKVTFSFDGTHSGGGVIDPNNPNNYQYNGVPQVADSMARAVQQALHEIIETEGSYVPIGLIGDETSITCFNLDSIKRNDNGTYGGKPYFVNGKRYSFSEYIDKQLHFDTSKIENVVPNNLFVYVEKNGDVPIYSYTDDTKKVTTFYTSSGEEIWSMNSQVNIQEKVDFVNAYLGLPERK